MSDIPVSKNTNVFICYAQPDIWLVKNLERALDESEFSTYRDIEAIQAGNIWPNILDEAISTCETFLLIWSENAVRSQFVEYEWTTALRLKKRIIICLADNTSLPKVLGTFQTIRLDDAAKILKKLGRKRGDWQINAKLRRTTWSQSSTKWLAAIVGLIILLSIMLVSKFSNLPLNDSSSSQLKGIVITRDNNPIEGVTVVTQFSTQRVVTDNFGIFNILVPAKLGDRVELIARQEGYAENKLYFVVPGPVQIILERER